ncbi:MAG: DUF4145 domain-containing protein [Acidobacteria bacterium]|nr:DUF4145 domain-containing protein [Acidobacteriota bacterium]
MPLTDEKITAQFNALQLEAAQILRQCRWDGENYYSHPNQIEYQRWRTQAINLIERVCGRTSTHYKDIRSIAETPESKLNGYYFVDCLGILEAASKDYADGLLSEIRTLVRAELLDDFLTQADALFKQGYHVPAASVAGAVLEDTLRKLCDKNGIVYDPAKSNLNVLNTELAKAEVYDKLVQKRITAEADLRNSADHGQFAKVKVNDVEDMLSWVRRFVEEHLT